MPRNENIRVCVDKFFVFVYLIISALEHIHFAVQKQKKRHEMNEREYEDAYK